jgi:hypothetical protein
MSKNATQELESALEKCEAIEASLTKEKKLLEDSAAELNALQKTIEVSDVGQLQRMTTLLTIAQVGGSRRTYRHQEFADARKALVDVSRQFVGTVFAPRLRQLESRAIAKVEKKLGQHFPDKDALRSAVQHSTEMLKLAPIQAQTVIQDYSTDGGMRLAKGLLEAWSAADAFEADQLN